jgi:hypothetical protein
MKRIALTLIVSLSLILTATAQEKEEKLKELEKLEQKTEATVPPDTLILDRDTLTVIDEEIIISDEKATSGDTSRIRIGEIVTVEDTDDETVIRIGHRGIRISEDENDTEVDFEKYPREDYAEHPGRRFRGHLGGIEFGFNNYSPEKWNTSVDPADPYFNLNNSKSTNFNLLLPSVSMGFTRHLGLVAAIGFNWSNYRFDAGNTIRVNNEGIVESYIPAMGEVKKSKLATTYAILPVMLEAQLPVSENKTINIGAGVIGALKLGSHTKVVYTTEGRFKDKDDFNLNLLRWGATARVGFEMFQIYGTYYLSPMFKHEKGPELYPFEIGIALTFND